MSEQPARELIGGRYQILTTLGKGGMGLVYRAHDPVLERDVAIKKMATSIVDSDEHRRRFQIEARAAARLNHPNIVTIFELEEYRGDFYIVMELLEGLSLASFMQRRPPLPLEAQLTVFAQVCDALDFAHARDIVHRDIKPANLILLPSGIVKILDFGIAQLASSDLTRKGVLLGTPNYMSPEQINGQPVDARADLFSAGAVAYEMAAGVKAFSADSMAMLLMKISEASYPPLSEVAPSTPPALVTLIAQLLSKNRDLRPARGCDVRAALEQIGAIDRLDLVADAVAEALTPTEGDTAMLRAPADRPTTPVASRSLVSPHRPGGSSRADTQVPAGGAPVPSPTSSSPSPVAGQAPGEDALAPASVSFVASAPLPTEAGFIASNAGAVASNVVIPPPLPPGLAPPEPSASAVAPAPPASIAGEQAQPQPQPRTQAGEPDASPLAETLVAPLGLLSLEAAQPDAPSVAVPEAVAPSAIAPPTASSVPASGQIAGAAAPSSSASPGAASVVPPLPAGAAAAQPSAAAASAPVVPGAAVPAARRAGKGTAIIVIGLLAAMLAVFVGASWLWWQRLRGSIKIPTYSASHETPANATTPPANASDSTTPPATPATEVATMEAKPGDVKPEEVKQGEATPGDGKATEPESAVETSPNPRGETPTADATPALPPVEAPTTPTAPVDTRRADSRPVDTRPSETRPATRERETTPDARLSSREPAPPVDSTPPPPPPPTPRSSGVKPAATEPDAAPPTADTPTPEPSRPGRSQRPRTAVDSETVNAFQRSGDATAQLGGNQTMNAAAVNRIKEILERYGRAIEQRDADTLHSLRDTLTPAEQKLLDGPSATVRFADIDVSVDTTTATARARRTITVSGRPAVTETVDVRLTRHPSGWVITSLSR